MDSENIDLRSTWKHLLHYLTSEDLSENESKQEYIWNEIFNFIQRNRGISLSKYVTICNEEDGCTVLHYACMQGNRENATARTTELLKYCKDLCSLPTLLAFVNTQNKNGNSALQLATKRMDKSLIHVLLEHGADTVTLKQKELDSTDIIYDDVLSKIYNAATLIELEDRERDLENQSIWRFKWNFSPITGCYVDNGGDKPLNQTRRLALLLRERTASKKVILEHPLVRVFLLFKEDKFTLLLYLSMLYHMLWSAVCFVYIFCNTHILDSTNTVNTSRDSNLTELCQSFKMFHGDSPTEFLSTWVFYFVLLFYLSSVLKEGIEFFTCDDMKHYLWQLGNLGRWLVNFTVFVVWIVNVITRLNSGDDGETFLESSHRIWNIFLPSLYIFGMFGSLLLLQVELGKTKLLGRHIEMFVYGFQRVVTFLLAFLPLLTAFLFTFHLLMPTRRAFVPSWGVGFAKILAMMTGEIDYDDTFYNEDEDDIEFRNVLKVFVLIFIVIAVILLQNLLIATNVSDGPNLEKKSHLRNMASKLEEIYLMENLMTRDWVIKLMNSLHPKGNWYKDWYSKTFTVDETNFKRKLKPRRWPLQTVFIVDEANINKIPVSNRWRLFSKPSKKENTEPSKIMRLSEYPKEIRKVIQDWIRSVQDIDVYIERQQPNNKRWCFGRMYN